MVRSIFIFAGIALGVVIALQLSWAIARMCLHAVLGNQCARWLEPLADALRGEKPVDLALLGARASVRWPYTWRLQRCVRRLNSDQPESLVPALLQCRLLPASCADIALAAAAQGPTCLARLFAGIAERERQRPQSARSAMAPYAGTMIILLLLATFIGVAIIPKFLMILKDLGMPDRYHISLLGHSPSAWSGILLAASPIGLGIAALFGSVLVRFIWRLRRRRLLADAVLGGLREEWPDQRLAELIGQARPRVAAAAASCGAHGDFKGLCRLAGWRANDPAQLARRISHYDARRARIHSIFHACARVVMPVLIGIPVGIFAYMLHGTLVHIVVTMAKELE